MVYYISVQYNEIVKSMSWVRSPFGLENWAESNVGHLIDKSDFDIPSDQKPLNYICNNWSYDNSNLINKDLFFKIIKTYLEAIQKLKKGYFYFKNIKVLNNYIPKKMQMEIKKRTYKARIKIYEKIKIDHDMYIKLMEKYNDVDYLFFNKNNYTLEHYKIWFIQLFSIAQLMIEKKSNVNIKN